MLETACSNPRRDRHSLLFEDSVQVARRDEVGRGDLARVESRLGEVLINVRVDILERSSPVAMTRVIAVRIKLSVEHSPNEVNCVIHEAHTAAPGEPIHVASEVRQERHDKFCDAFIAGDAGSGNLRDRLGGEVDQ